MTLRLLYYFITGHPPSVVIFGRHRAEMLELLRLRDVVVGDGSHDSTYRYAKLMSWSGGKFPC